ncbi:MAG: FtsX-like permease family protein, partial [Collinsella sp.]
TFKVLSPADAYRKNEETGMWADMSGDADFMAAKVADGIDVRIVGVVRPNETANASALSPGIAYTHALTRQLMERAADSKIVQEQLAHPETDVFTGKTFDELQGEAKQGVDLGSMFSVDEAALKSAFSFDASALSGVAGGMDLSGIDLSGLDIDLSGVGEDIDFNDIMAKAPAPDFSGVFDGLELTPEQMQQVGALANQLFEGFMQSDQFKALTPEDLKDATKLAAAFSAYLENDAAAQQCLAQLKALGGDVLAERLQQAMTDYVQKQLAPYLQQAMDQVMKAISEQIATTVSSQLKAGAAGLMGQMATQMSSSFANLASAMHVDASAFARAIHFNMDAEDLSSLMMSYAKASQLTYDNNLTTLCYADEADPISVKIFPRDFEAKDRVLDHIDAYNKQVKAAGHDEQAISYTDYMGIIMGSVTDIVNTISLVLIAFVSISLVVSSIMIGIITYISVLERKKEIGILRAIGASKRNVANVFNAETFIEGLIAGVFAIAVVVLVSLPVNAWALATKQVPNLMSLPVQDALALIAISVV